jgi:hypothetical protein
MLVFRGVLRVRGESSLGYTAGIPLSRHSIHAHIPNAVRRILTRFSWWYPFYLPDVPRHMQILSKKWPAPFPVHAELAPTVL